MSDGVISKIQLPNENTYDIVDNTSGYITSYTETDPIFSASAAAGITSSDISNWNSIISDDGKWNGVSLTPSTADVAAEVLIPTLESTSSTSAKLAHASSTPSSYKIAKYESGGYLKSTTPSSNDNSTKVATTAYVDSAITALPEPMIFKGSLGTGGTITALPAAASSNEGFTYKVITAGTYASQSAKIGDTFISDGSSWVLIPSGDEPSGTVTSVSVSNATNGGLSISGSPVTSSGTISIGHSNVLSSAQTTQAVYPIKIDKNGHISAYGSAVSIPTKTSDLTNDSGFITSSAIPTLLSGSTTTITPTQVINALANNQNVEISYTDATYGTSKVYDFTYNVALNMITAPLIFRWYGEWLLFELVGRGSDDTWYVLDAILAQSSDIPTNTSDLTNDSGFINSIKTINNTSLVGSGNVDVQPTLVSGTNIKTINNTSLIGSGNVNTVAAQIIRW